MAEIRWTPQQAAAIRAESNTLLVANAGTGKTATVVGKMLWLLGLRIGIDPDTGEPLSPCTNPCKLGELAAITFTEKAAYDLKRKLREAIEQSERGEQLRWQLDRASVGTIHSFCGTLLREHALRLDIDPTFRVLDENETWAAQDQLVRDLVMERLQGADASVQGLLKGRRLSGVAFRDGVIDLVRKALRDVRWRPDRYAAWSRDGSLDRESLAALAGDWDAADDTAFATTATLVDLAFDAAERWEQYLLEENARDFDSLVLDVLRLLHGPDGEAALEGIRRRYRVLIIDEFQDTDYAQRDIAFAIGRHAPRPQLFLVGDPKQSIYRFRGADIAVWNSVQEVLGTEGEVLELSTNFRCDPVVIDFVNTATASALGATGTAIGREAPESRVPYAALEPGLEAARDAGVEWLDPGDGKPDEIRAAEARHVVARIRQMVENEQPITDPETGGSRPCRFSDIALLYRNRTGLEHFEAELSQARIPYWLSGAPHLNERQEILDLVNVLKLLRNPRDDVRALGYLRSPFVALRDEVVTRLRMESPHKPLLAACRDAVAGGAEWHPAPEHARLVQIEREALRRGLDAVDTLSALVPRVPLDELLEQLLDLTGYRLHLLLSDHPEEALANLQSFLHFSEGYREHDIGSFLAVWDRFSAADLGIPQAPLYSKQDEVVTLSTIHAAKGLEWPVVFLLGVEKPRWREPSGEYLADRKLGPVLCASKDDRGPRNRKIVRRDVLEADAEEARLMYVATTRARDRLVVVGSRGKPRAYSEWLESGVGPGQVTVVEPPPSGGEETATGAPVPRVAWVDGFQLHPCGELVPALEPPELRFIVSATELMARDKDPEAWERRFVHGALGPWEFVRSPAARGAIAPTVRGTLIHGVLERIEDVDELSRILEETIGGLEDPELSAVLRPGAEARETLEQEIRRVVQSSEWAWYVQGEHYRELEFAHLFSATEWRIGALDLYRDSRPEPAPQGQFDLFAATPDAAGALIVDFKTHEIEAAEVARAAAGYQIQARVYRAAARCRSEARVQLHFTGPNQVVDMPAESPREE